MKCQYCGRPLGDKTGYCQFCGKKQPVEKGGARAEGFPKWLLPLVVIVAVLLLIVSVMSIILGHQNPDTLEEPDDTVIVVTDPPTEETIEETTIPPEPPTQPTEPPFRTDVAWVQAYYQTILAFEQEHPELNADSTLKYRLLFIDDDEIPELYMKAREASSLYTIVDDEAVQVYDAMNNYDDQLIGVRTRRGTYLASRTTKDGERYTVYKLKGSSAAEVESYYTDGTSYMADGTSTDLVGYTQAVRAKQSAYQLTDIPQYTKAALLDALKKTADGKNIPEPAADEETMTVETVSPTEKSSDPSATDTIDGSAESGEKRFEVYAGTYTWSQAQAKCEEKGGHLAYIKSASDYSAVMEAVEGTSLTYLWVGGKTTINDDGSVTAKWSDGSSTSYLDSAGLWFGHEPSGKDGDIREPYMMLWNISGWSFNDNSDSCVNIYAEGTMGYICEFDD